MMRLIGSFVAAIVGSVVGAAARMGVEMAAGAGADDDGGLEVSGSIAAAAGGAILGTLLGGPRLAFWASAVLSAAGAERLDQRLLAVAGVDRDALVARAMELGERARQARSASSGGEEPAA